MLINPLWLIAFVIIGSGLWVGYRYQIQTLFSGALWFGQGEWGLKSDNSVAQRYRLVGEALCWSLLIILPVEDVDSGKRKYLLIANDAVSPADRARLRTWLRVCLKPKG